jgi:hypothetical protein
MRIRGIQYPGMEKIWIEGQGSGMEKFGSRIWYLGWKKFGSGINIQDQQKWKSRCLIC